MLMHIVRKEILEHIKAADARHDELIEANLIENDSWEGKIIPI